VGKKVYKKNKKVKEIVIYKRAHPYEKITSSAFIFVGFALIAATIFYYLNTFSFTYNTSIFSQKDIHTQLTSGAVLKSENTAVVPFTADWQEKLLPQIKVSSVPTVKKKMIAKKEDKSAEEIIWHGPRDKKEVALTFDADMTPVMVDWLHSGQVSNYNDTRITDYLAQNQVKATFFLTGLWIQSYPNATRALADNPLFELENHTYSHPSMAGYCFGQPQIPTSQYPFEIEKTQQLIEQYTHQTPKYFRFSGGCYDQADLALVKKEGLQTVHWDDVADDGFNNNKQQIINNVLSEVQNGSIIVLHLGGEATNTPQTGNALPTIINGLKEKGYTFVTVDELLTPQKIVAQVTPAEYLTSLESFQTVSP